MERGSDKLETRVENLEYELSGTCRDLEALADQIRIDKKDLDMDRREDNLNIRDLIDRERKERVLDCRENQANIAAVDVRLAHLQERLERHDLDRDVATADKERRRKRKQRDWEQQVERDGKRLRQLEERMDRLLSTVETESKTLQDVLDRVQRELDLLHEEH